MGEYSRRLTLSKMDISANAIVKCYTCKQEKESKHYTLTMLRTGYRRCMECERTKSKQRYLKQKAKKEENPWLKKMQSIGINVDVPQTRKLWTADVAQNVWLSQLKRCALTNDEIDETSVAFVKIDKDKDLEPSNAAVINRWLVSRTKKKDFSWTKEELARIHDAKGRLVTM